MFECVQHFCVLCVCSVEERKIGRYIGCVPNDLFVEAGEPMNVKQHNSYVSERTVCASLFGVLGMPGITPGENTAAEGLRADRYLTQSMFAFLDTGLTGYPSGSRILHPRSASRSAA